MSLQETVRKEESSVTASKKKINAASQAMVLEILQDTQYSKPVESTIRELVSNGIDSQREKEIALLIMNGEAKPEDFYVKRTEGQYADSNFDPAYYDKKWLSTKDKVIIAHHHNDDGRDRLVITDYGVGLSPDKYGKELSRLEGYLELGYSSKRNSLEQIGGFGLGAKVPLSTNIDHFITTTVHNGRRFKLRIGMHSYDSLVPRFGEDGNLNPHVTFNDGTVVHYEEVDEFNRTSVEFETKMHLRNKFHNAVYDQLLYFDEVEFYTYDIHGEERKQYFHSDVLYNTKSLIISDNWRYSKPHVVITKPGQEDQPKGMCYGYIDFQELEMETLRGQVGFKCPIRSVVRDPETGEEIVISEGLEVTPSRESVIWSEHTKSYVKKVITEARAEATEMVSKALAQGTDNEKAWMAVGFGQGHRDQTMSDNKAFQELSRIVNREELDPEIEIGGYLFPLKFAWGAFFLEKKVVKKTAFSKEHNTTSFFVAREDVSGSMRSALLSSDKVVLLDSDSSYAKTKDVYLLNEELHAVSALYIRPRQVTDAMKKLLGDKFVSRVRAQAVAKGESLDDALRTIQGKLVQMLEEKSSAIYEDVEVPEDFSCIAFEEGEEDKFSTDNIEAGETTLVHIPTPAERSEDYARRRFMHYDAPIMSLRSDGVKAVIGNTKEKPLLYMLDKLNLRLAYNWDARFNELVSNGQHGNISTTLTHTKDTPAFIAVAENVKNEMQAYGATLLEEWVFPSTTTINPMLKEILTLRKCRQIWEERVSYDNSIAIVRHSPHNAYRKVDFETDFFGLVQQLHDNYCHLERHHDKITRLDQLSKNEESEIWKVVMMMADGVVDGEMELLDQDIIDGFTEMCDYYEENASDLIPLVLAHDAWGHVTEESKTTIVRHMNALSIPKYEGNLVIL